MGTSHGLRVTVQGDLPRAVVAHIADAVRHAVLTEIATLDIGPALHEIPFDAGGLAVPAPIRGDLNGPGDLPGIGPIILGIVLRTDPEFVSGPEPE
jgi:hypothetical protein